MYHNGQMLTVQSSILRNWTGDLNIVRLKNPNNAFYVGDTRSNDQLILDSKFFSFSLGMLRCY
jgi:hypothetical protein